jgi:hypothetical protein
LAVASYALLMFGGLMVPATATGGPGPNPAAALLPMAGLLGLLVVLVLQLLYVYRLAAALEVGLPILWVLGVVLLSCIGLVLLLILSSKATKELRKAGFRVGLLGGNPKEIEKQMRG